MFSQTFNYNLNFIIRTRYQIISLCNAKNLVLTLATYIFTNHTLGRRYFAGVSRFLTDKSFLHLHIDLSPIQHIPDPPADHHKR